MNNLSQAYAYEFRKRQMMSRLYSMLYRQAVYAPNGGGAAESPIPTPDPKPDPEPDVIAESQDELKAALADAEDGDVIQLDASFTLASDGPALFVNKDVTLDLNGCSIDAGSLTGSTHDAVIAVNRGGTLTVNGPGNIAGSDSVWAAIKLTTPDDGPTGDSTKLVINGGDFKGKYYAVTGHGERHNTEVVINGGTFEGTTVNDSAAIFHPQDGIMTINGGTFIGANSVFQKSGRIIVNGGNFVANGISAEFIHSNNGWNNTGDAFTVEACNYPGGMPSVEINGGSFVSKNGQPIASYAKDSSVQRLTKFVKGGTFNKKIDDELVADGYVQVQSGSVWTVVKQ